MGVLGKCTNMIHTTQKKKTVNHTVFFSLLVANCCFSYSQATVSIQEFVCALTPVSLLYNFMYIMSILFVKKLNFFTALSKNNRLFLVYNPKCLHISHSDK